MHGLANILSDSPSLQLTNELQEFSEVLSSVQNGLNRSIKGIQVQRDELSTNTAKVVDVNKTPPPLAAWSPYGDKQR